MNTGLGTIDNAVLNDVTGGRAFSWSAVGTAIGEETQRMNSWGAKHGVSPMVTSPLGVVAGAARGTLNQLPPPNMLASAGLVAVLPCLLLVLLFHRRIIAGLTEGLVKG